MIAATSHVAHETQRMKGGSNVQGGSLGVTGFVMVERLSAQ
jgi:hypothetical protein